MNLFPDSQTLAGPIVLSPKDIAEFQQIMKEETSRAYTDAEARARADELIRFFRMLVMPKHAAQQQAIAPVSRLTKDAGAVIGILEELRQSLILIRPRSKDWAWAVRVVTRLLSPALTTRIQTAEREQPGAPMTPPLNADDLPALLRRARREGVEVSEVATRSVDRLHRMTRELKWITVDTWTILADHLPRLLTDALDLSGHLLWSPEEPTPILTDDEREAAQKLDRGIRDRLLVLEAERLK